MKTLACLILLLSSVVAAPSGKTALKRPGAPMAQEVAQPAAPDKPAAYIHGHELLLRAKELSRQALPGMSHQNEHLRESLRLYEQCSREFEKALTDPTLTPSQRNEIDQLLPKINQQIYWGLKFAKV